MGSPPSALETMSVSKGSVFSTEMLFVASLLLWLQVTLPKMRCILSWPHALVGRKKERERVEKVDGKEIPHTNVSLDPHIFEPVEDVACRVDPLQ